MYGKSDISLKLAQDYYTFMLKKMLTYSFTFLYKSMVLWYKLRKRNLVKFSKISNDQSAYTAQL